jgi:threonine/homoserine/homoserine lactone efflux protein
MLSGAFGLIAAFGAVSIPLLLLSGIGDGEGSPVFRASTNVTLMATAGTAALVYLGYRLLRFSLAEEHEEYFSRQHSRPAR